ncbi:MAG TPA: hypothetical protein PLN53_07060 [Terricaulis sp.]|nr:hypothetical protein [Terricaulis sp.]
MAFREKIAWISLFVYGLVFGGYFLNLAQAWDTRWAQGLSIGLMAAAVVALVVLSVALTVTVALISPKQANAPADEREQLMALKAERVASYTLSVGVVLLIGALLMGWNGFLVANLLLAAMVISELVKALALIIAYRWGA